MVPGAPKISANKSEGDSHHEAGAALDDEKSLSSASGTIQFNNEGADDVSSV